MKARDRVIQHMPKNAVGAEIGVHLGDYSQKIINIANPKLLYLIDPWTMHDKESHANSWYGKNNVTQDTMDKRYKSVCERFKKENVKILRDFSDNAAKNIPDESLDFIYIDGDHSFEGTCNDFDAFYSKVKSGGYIYGDDYIDNNWWGSGVIDALHKNLHDKNLKLIFLDYSQYCCVKK